MTAIPRRSRLIVALDVPTAAEARALVERIGDAAVFYKIGLELAMAGGYFELLEWLVKRGNQVFVDLKVFDIPETVARAVAPYSMLMFRCIGVEYQTVPSTCSGRVGSAWRGKCGTAAATLLLPLLKNDYALAQTAPASRGGLEGPTQLPELLVREVLRLHLATAPRAEAGWITSLGFALNVATDLGFFDAIVPCGIREHGVTSMGRLLGEAPDMGTVGDAVVAGLSEVFGFRAG